MKLSFGYDTFTSNNPFYNHNIFITPGKINNPLIHLLPGLELF